MTTEPIVLNNVVTFSDFPEAQLRVLRERYPSVTFLKPDKDAWLDALKEADAAIIGWQLPDEEVQAAQRLRWVQTIGAGVEHAITPTLKERGIVLTNMSGVHAPNIAEMVMAMLLAHARRLPFLIRGQIAHEWRDDSGRRGVFELDGQRMLLVGYGNIASEIAKRAHCFGMETVGVKRNPTEASANGTTILPMSALRDEVGKADHIVICLPITRETTNLFDGDLLAACKLGSFLYNVGRGAVINSDALIAALERKQIAGAGLDVTDPEPLPTESPLWDMENVIITSHTSGATPRYWHRAMPILLENLDAVVTGKLPTRNLVDVDAGY